MQKSTVLSLAALLLTVAPSFAVVIDFEKNWDYGTAVDNYYAGGLASDATSGPNLGVSFTNVLGLSNDAFFVYYQNAPSPLGAASVQLDGTVNVASYMNVPAGAAGLSFFYSSPSDVPAAIKAYSGPNGTVSLLGTLDLTANDAGGSSATESGYYTVWTQAFLAFVGTAQSFDLTGMNNVVGFDNISTTVPEPATVGLAATGLALLARRRK